MGGGGKYTSLASTPLPMWHRPAHRRRWRLSLPTLASAAALCFITGMLLLWRYRPPPREPSRVRGRHEHGHIASSMSSADALRAMYTDPDAATRTDTASCSAGSRQYSLLVVADQDEAAINRTTGDLQSTLRRGVLCESPGSSYSVSWLDSVRLRSRLSLAGRGMELSTLTWFGDRLLSCDDRTGIVYEIGGGSARPRHILSTAAAGGQFKCEWAAVRRGLLYIGGIGRPFRTPASADSPAAGPTVTGNDMVVSIDTAGALSYHNFSNVYAELCRAAGCGTRGYATHEAAAWVDGASAGEGKWVFAPRRVSTEPFDEALDEVTLIRKRGSRRETESMAYTRKQTCLCIVTSLLFSSQKTVTFALAGARRELHSRVRGAGRARRLAQRRRRQPRRPRGCGALRARQRPGGRGQ